MRNLIIVGVVMLFTGFAVGWIAKPATGIPPVVAKPHPVVAKGPAYGGGPSSDAPPPGKRSIREEGEPKAASMDGGEGAAQEMQGKMNEGMVERMRKRLEIRVERLSEKLELTAEQKRKMTDWLEGKLKEFGTMDYTNLEVLMQAGTKEIVPTENAMMDVLAPSLTREQGEGLIKYRESERRNKVDTVALKSLMRLQEAMEFEEGQRDEVFRILAESTEKKLDADAGKLDVGALFSEQMSMGSMEMNVDSDPYNMGIMSAIMEMAIQMKWNEGQGTDENKQMEMMREVMNKRIEERVELLRPVLDDKQLEIYRNELKTKGLGVYGQMFLIEGGME